MTTFHSLRQILSVTLVVQSSCDVNHLMKDKIDNIEGLISYRGKCGEEVSNKINVV